SKVQSKITITGFKSGEAIKNDIEGPNGALDDNNPAKIGIVEQEQNGVNAPSPVPYKYPLHLFGRSSTRLMLSSVTFCCNHLTKKLMKINNTVNSNKILKNVCKKFKKVSIIFPPTSYINFN